MKLDRFIRSVPNFPKNGIIFRDITTLLNEPRAFKYSIDQMARILQGKEIDVIVAAESRGFIFGGALAYKFGCSFVPIRKSGKLPYKVRKITYSLEYGKDCLEIHQDGFRKGARVLILDDLLATGGTAKAIVKLVKKLGGKIAAILFLIELTSLRGRSKLTGFPVHSLIKF